MSRSPSGKVKVFDVVVVATLAIFIALQPIAAQTVLPCATFISTAAGESQVADCTQKQANVTLIVGPGTTMVVLSNVECDVLAVESASGSVENAVVTIRGSRMKHISIPSLSNATIEVIDTTIELVDTPSPIIELEGAVVDSIVHIDRSSLTTNQSIPAHAEVIKQQSGAFTRSTLNITNSVISASATELGRSAYGILLQVDVSGATIALDGVNFTMAASATAALYKHSDANLVGTSISMRNTNAAMTSSGTYLWCVVQWSAVNATNVAFTWDGGSFTTEATIQRVSGVSTLGGTIDESQITFANMNSTATTSFYVLWFAFSSMAALRNSTMAMIGSDFTFDLSAGSFMYIFNVEDGATVADSVSKMQNTSIVSIGSNAIQAISVVSGNGPASRNYSVALVGCTIRLTSVKQQLIVLRIGNSGADSPLEEVNGAVTIEASDIELRITGNVWAYVVCTDKTVSNFTTYVVQSSRIHVEAVGGEAVGYYSKLSSNNFTGTIVNNSIVNITSHKGGARLFHMQGGGQYHQHAVQDSVVTLQSNGGTDGKAYTFDFNGIRNATTLIDRAAVSMSGENGDMAIFVLRSGSSSVRMEVLRSDVTATGGAQALGYFNSDSSAMNSNSFFAQHSQLMATATKAAVLHNSRPQQILTSIILDNVTATVTSMTTAFFGMIRAQGPNGNISISRSRLVYSGARTAYGVLLLQGPIAFSMQDTTLDVSGSIAFGVEIEEFPRLKSAGPLDVTLLRSTIQTVASPDSAMGFRATMIGANLEDFRLKIADSTLNVFSSRQSVGLALYPQSTGWLNRANITISRTNLDVRGLASTGILLKSVRNSALTAEFVTSNASEVQSNYSGAAGLVVTDGLEFVSFVVQDSVVMRHSGRFMRSSVLHMFNAVSNCSFVMTNLSQWCNGGCTLIVTASRSDVFSDNQIVLTDSSLSGTYENHVNFSFWGVFINAPWRNSILRMTRLRMNVTTNYGAASLVWIVSDLDEDSSILIDDATLSARQGRADGASPVGVVYTSNANINASISIVRMTARVSAEILGFKVVELNRGTAANRVTIADSTFEADVGIGFSSVFLSTATSIGPVVISNVSCNFTSALEDKEQDWVATVVLVAKSHNELPTTVSIHDVVVHFAAFVPKGDAVLRSTGIHLIRIDNASDVAVRAENASLTASLPSHSTRVASNVSVVSVASAHNVTFSADGVRITIADAPSSDVSVAHLSNATECTIIISDIAMNMGSPSIMASAFALRDGVINSSVMISEILGSLHAESTAGVVTFDSTDAYSIPAGFSGNQIDVSGSSLTLVAPRTAGVYTSPSFTGILSKQRLDLRQIAIVSSATGTALFLDMSSSATVLDLTLSDVHLSGNWEMISPDVGADTFDPTSRVVLNCSWIDGHRIIPAHFRQPLHDVTSFGPADPDTQRLLLCPGSMTPSSTTTASRSHGTPSSSSSRPTSASESQSLAETTSSTLTVPSTASVSSSMPLSSTLSASSTATRICPVDLTMVPSSTTIFNLRNRDPIGRVSIRLQAALNSSLEENVNAKIFRNDSAIVARALSTSWGRLEEVTVEEPLHQAVIAVLVSPVEPREVPLSNAFDVQIFVISAAFVCNPGFATLPDPSAAATSHSTNIKFEASKSANGGESTLEEAIAAVATTSTSLSGVLSNPTSGMLQARAAAAQALSLCEYDHDEPLDFTTSPTGLSVGHARGSFYRGALVGNFILMVAVSAFGMLCTLMFYRGGRRTLWQAMGAVHVPGVLIVPVAELLQGTVSSATSLIFHGGGGTADVVLSVTAFSLVSVVWVGVVYITTFGRRAVVVQRPSYVDDSLPKMRRFVVWLFLSSEKWIDDPQDSNSGGFKIHWQQVFTDFRNGRTWFLGVELAVSFMVGVLSGVRNPSDCETVAALFLALLCVQALMAVTLRPFIAPFESMFHITLSCLNCLAALLLVVGERIGSSRMVSASETVGIVTMILSAFKLLVDVLFLFRWFYSRYSVLRRKRAELALQQGRASGKPLTAKRCTNRRVGLAAADDELIDEDAAVGSDFEQLAERVESVCRWLVAKLPRCALPQLVQSAGSDELYDDADVKAATKHLEANPRSESSGEVEMLKVNSHDDGSGVLSIPLLGSSNAAIVESEERPVCDGERVQHSHVNAMEGESVTSPIVDNMDPSFRPFLPIRWNTRERRLAHERRRAKRERKNAAPAVSESTRTASPSVDLQHFGNASYYSII